MTWKCTGCGASVDEKAIDRELALAHCRYCGGVFDLGGLEVQREGKPERVPFVERATVGLPDRFSVKDGGGQFSVAWREDACGCGCLLFLCLLVAIGASAALGWLGTSPFLEGWARPVMLVFVVGLAGVLLSIVGFFQRTTVAVAEGLLTVRHGPLPMGEAVKLSVHDIVQIFCVADESAATDDEDVKEVASLVATYDVVVKRRDGRRTRLVEDLDELDQALFVEQQLERYLGIRDAAVSGEVPRSEDS
ncbi:MAG: hypothetical protein ACYTG4_00755 [Planctomycetota bacterium]|jgi:hypothetical protein